MRNTLSGIGRFIRGPVCNGVMDSIDCAVKRMRIKHVGISSDSIHGAGVVGWEDEGECQNVTAELLERDIAKLWGSNFLRMWAEAQKVGKTLQAHHQALGQ